MKFCFLKIMWEWLKFLQLYCMTYSEQSMLVLQGKVIVHIILCIKFKYNLHQVWIGHITKYMILFFQQ
jgi:hypothetical protein